MEAVKEIVLTACIALVLIEVLYFLTPREKLVDCVYGLVYTAILFSGILAITKTDWNLDFQTELRPYAEKIDAVVQEYYMLETENELKKTVKEALDTVHIACKDVSLMIHVDQEENIRVNNIAVHLAYQSDIDRATVILNQLFGNALALEVTGEE